MKLSIVAILGVASVVVANDNESTVTVTKSGWDPEATNVPGRFDHTTRLTTTTVWTGDPPLNENVDSTTSNEGLSLGSNLGVLGAIVAAGIFLL